MLVLLIIFMITAPLLDEGIKVELPKAGAEPIDPEMLKDSKPLVLTVDRDGRYYLNSAATRINPIDEADVVERGPPQCCGATPETPVLVKADERVPTEESCGMVLLQQAGAEKVGFITDPPKSGGALERR